LPPNKGEAERRKARGIGRVRAQAKRRLCCAMRRAPSSDALAFRRSTAALANGLESRWLSPVPRFMVADNRSAPRAASSWQTGDVAGRASFRTARGRGYEPHPGHRSRSINQPSPVDVPWPSEMVFFSSPRRPTSRNSIAASHPVDLTRVLFRCLFDSLRHKCGPCFDSNFFVTNVPRGRRFLNCGNA
jgi:hypothetical protein